MKRRERLTGFLIIFTLLIFSAYSNSMNVGGRSLESSFQSSDLNNNLNYQKQNSFITKNSKQDRVKNEALSQENETGFNSDELRENEIVKSLNKNERKITNNEKNFNNFKRTEKKEIKEREIRPLIDRVKVHTVRSGETLWDIAKKHNLNIDSLIGANNISNMNTIKPGQKFKILPIKGVMYRVSPGESIASIAKKFNIKSEVILKDNNIDDASNLKIDQKLILRGAEPEFSYKDRLEKKFMYPINTRITSYYGPRWGRIHEGVDFAAPMGSPIRAVGSGRVVYSGWASGYGKVVIIEHQKGLRSLYAHNSKLLVRTGESVGKGEVISRSGNTGNSTGPHLHLEIQVNGRPENPLDYLHK